MDGSRDLTQSPILTQKRPPVRWALVRCAATLCPERISVVLVVFRDFTFAWTAVVGYVGRVKGRTAMATLDELIDLYNKRAETLRRVRELLDGDPDLKAALLEALSQPQDVDTPKREPVTTRMTYADKVRQWFGERGNKFATRAEVAKALGVTPNNLVTVFYGERKIDFESRPNPRDKRGVQWRLRKEVSNE